MGRRETWAAPAKVNLYLHVIGKRPDAYHLLDSLVVFADVADTVEAAPGELLTLNVDGPFWSKVSHGHDNLVLRAARALAGAAGIEPRAAIRLHKNLPVAAGIGGGSGLKASEVKVPTLPSLSTASKQYTIGPRWIATRPWSALTRGWASIRRIGIGRSNTITSPVFQWRQSRA